MSQPIPAPDAEQVAAWRDLFGPPTEPGPIVVDEDGDPRGDDACPECDEGTLVHTGRRHPAATQVECNVCGFSA